MTLELQPGSLFGRYEIQSELGRGGMGMVYRARDTSLDRVVALKILSDNLSRSVEFSERFSREARAAARLNHVNIVHVYDLGAVDGQLYIAMEFIEGRTLGNYLRPRGRFTESDAVALVREVARALAVAHAAGIVHRDIKPDNIMVTADGVVKVVDLGLAKKISTDESASHTETGFTLGTPAYMSPEQIKGEKDIDGRADIYSLGATLFHFVTGRPPYEGATGAVITMRHMIDPVPDPREVVPNLSDGFCAVLRRMMAKARGDRYPDCATLERDLGQLLSGGEPVETGTTSAPTPITTTTSLDSPRLKLLEEALAAAIGPMARVLVKKKAATAQSFDSLCQDLAEQIPTEKLRRDFLTRVRSTSQSMSAPAAAGTAPLTSRTELLTGGATPVTAGQTRGTEILGTTAITTAMAAGASEVQLGAVERALAQHIGPLAKVLVKRAAKRHAALAELAAALAENIPAEADRQKFLSEVRKLS